MRSRERPLSKRLRLAAVLMLAAAALACTTGSGRLPSGDAMSNDDAPYPVTKTDDEWREQLTPVQYAVLRRHDTEFAGTSPLNTEHRDGMFVCAGCGQPLFRSDTKYDSGSGWPSFYDAIEGAVRTSEDRTLGMRRIEFHCARCGGHLGHVFPDGPRPTGLRYCTNGAALEFKPVVR